MSWLGSKVRSEVHLWYSFEKVVFWMSTWKHKGGISRCLVLFYFILLLWSQLLNKYILGALKRLLLSEWKAWNYKEKLLNIHKKNIPMRFSHINDIHATWGERWEREGDAVKTKRLWFPWLCALAPTKGNCRSKQTLALSVGVTRSSPPFKFSLSWKLTSTLPVLLIQMWWLKRSAWNIHDGKKWRKTEQLMCVQSRRSFTASSSV